MWLRDSPLGHPFTKEATKPWKHRAIPRARNPVRHASPTTDPAGRPSDPKPEGSVTRGEHTRTLDMRAASLCASGCRARGGRQARGAALAPACTMMLPQRCTPHGRSCPASSAGVMTTGRAEIRGVWPSARDDVPALATPAALSSRKGTRRSPVRHHANDDLVHLFDQPKWAS